MDRISEVLFHHVFHHVVDSQLCESYENGLHYHCYHLQFRMSHGPIVSLLNPCGFAPNGISAKACITHDIPIAPTVAMATRRITEIVFVCIILRLILRLHSS